MANLLRFAPFRGELEVQSPTMKCPWRETAQIAKPSEGQRVSDCRCLHVDSPILSDSVPNQRESGEEAAEGPRSKTSKHTPRPKPLCFKISVPRTRPLHLRTLTSHRCCKVQIVFVQSKIVKLQRLHHCQGATDYHVNRTSINKQPLYFTSNALSTLQAMSARA